MMTKPTNTTGQKSKPARKPQPVLLFCHVKGCHAALETAEIDAFGRVGLKCPKCGAAYCYRQHPYKPHYTIARYLPVIGLSDTD